MDRAAASETPVEADQGCRNAKPEIFVPNGNKAASPLALLRFAKPHAMVAGGILERRFGRLRRYYERLRSGRCEIVFPHSSSSASEKTSGAGTSQTYGATVSVRPARSPRSRSPATRDRGRKDTPPATRELYHCGLFGDLTHGDALWQGLPEVLAIVRIASQELPGEVRAIDNTSATRRPNVATANPSSLASVPSTVPPPPRGRISVVFLLTELWKR